MMVLISPRHVVRRLVVVALILSLILPGSAAVSRADDEPVIPEIIPPMTEPQATATVAATATPRVRAISTPVASTPNDAAPPAPLAACDRPPGRPEPTSWRVEGNDPVNDMRGTIQATFKARSEEHTSELQSLRHLVCRLLLQKKKKKNNKIITQQKKNIHKSHITTT